MNRLLLIVTVVLFLSGVGLADHLPEHLLTSGRSEKTLAGIDLDRSKMLDVVKLYGEPHCVIKHEYAPEKRIVNSYEYYWDIGKIRLQLFVLRDDAIIGGEQIAMIEVTGPTVTGRLGRTGSGLALGDSLAKIERIYGKKFVVRKISEYDIHDLMIQWKRSGNSLSADLNAENRIKSLTLLAPD